MCGEKEIFCVFVDGIIGSPPRVRGKVSCMWVQDTLAGITPACAGKRQGDCNPCGQHRDHPRVCGEKLRLIRSAAWFPGSPPRVRGKVFGAVWRSTGIGITPACAGKSW